MGAARPILYVAGLGCASCVGTAWGQTPVVLGSGDYVSPAAAAEQAAICPTGVGYPAQFTWDPAATTFKPVAATSGTPRIDQIRKGKKIASYTSFTDKPGCTYKLDGTDNIDPRPAARSGCGPFTRPKGWRLWQAGDHFRVYPAVYAGIYNDPWFGPEYDKPADFPNYSHPPDNVVIEGVVQNGVRPVIYLDGAATYNTLYQAPVYFDTSNGMVMSNIDVVSASSGSVMKAGIYDRSARNLTLRNVRISGFRASLGNGLFAADQTAGTLLLDQVELDHNGGPNPNGLAHNAYINTSSIDPKFKLVMQNSWSHDGYFGHLFKTRAQNNVFTGNYFQGGVPAAGDTHAENYLLDVPNGGTLNLRNNIFVKNASGSNANGVSITFAVEGVPDARKLSLDIENNSFVTFAETYDGQHNNYPFSFFYPNLVPGTATWPASAPYRIIKNAFVGYCPSPGNDVVNYRGDIDVTEAFAELSPQFALSTKVESDEAALAASLKRYVKVAGTNAYAHVEQPGVVRAVPTIGAAD